jgi:hypothetical protein
MASASTSSRVYRNTFPNFEDLRSPIPFKIAINRSERSLRELYNKPPSFEHAIRGMAYELTFMSAMMDHFDCYPELELSSHIELVDTNIKATYASLQALMDAMYTKVAEVGNYVCNTHEIPAVDNLCINLNVPRRNLGYRDRRYWPRNSPETVHQEPEETDQVYDSDSENSSDDDNILYEDPNNDYQEEIVPSDPGLVKSLLIKKESPILYAYHCGQMNRKRILYRSLYMENIDLNSHEIDFNGKNLSDIMDSKSDCNICTQNMSNSEFLYTNACCHCFCMKCMDTMFQNKIGIKCPLCRTIIHRKSVMTVVENDQMEYVFTPTYK